MRSPSRCSLLVLASLGLGLAGGCGPYEAPLFEEASGALGNGVFRWGCINDSDPTCGTGVFPPAVALDAQFRLEFFGASDLPEDLGHISVKTASTAWIASIVGGFVTAQTGDASVIALGGGYAVDYITLSVRPVDDLMLSEYVTPESDTCTDRDGRCDDAAGPVDSPVALSVGEITTLRAQPLGGGSNLGGALPYSWRSLTPSLLEVSRPRDRSAQVNARGKGLARISVQAGDFVKVFEFEVVDPPPERKPVETGSTGDTDTGSDTGSGSGSDSGSGSGSGSGSDSGSGSGETDGSTTTGGR